MTQTPATWHTRSRFVVRICSRRAAAPSRRRRGSAFRFPRVLFVAGGLAWLVSSARGQEALRLSLAGAEAVEARRKAASTLGFYNLKLGPAGWHFSSGLGVQFTDNVNLNGTNPETDLSFSPQLNTQMIWPLTEKNTLNLSIGVGYLAYVQHSELDRIFVTPGSELSFDVYVGDFWINLHDRFSLLQNAYQDPTVSGSGNYTLFQNSVGQTTVWDLDKVKIALGYDHANYVSLSGNTSPQNTSASDLFSASTAYVPRGGLSLGLELSGGLSQSTGTNAQDATQWSAGSFLDTQLSQYIHFKGSLGYTVYELEQGGTPAVPLESSGFYGQLALSHNLNRFLSYSLSGGHSVTFAFLGGAVELSSVTLGATWNLLRKVTIGTTFAYENGKQIGFSSETFDRYGAAINLGRAFTAKLSGSVGYQFYLRESDLAGRGYTANIFSLNLTYTF